MSGNDRHLASESFLLVHILSSVSRFVKNDRAAFAVRKGSTCSNFSPAPHRSARS
nr:MAG TPA: hypothetical protein [Bacteriophage sp.]